MMSKLTIGLYTLVVSQVSDTTSAVGAILNDYNVTSIKFFTNAVSTTTSGIDFVGTYSGLEAGTWCA